MIFIYRILTEKDGDGSIAGRRSNVKENDGMTSTGTSGRDLSIGKGNINGKRKINGQNKTKLKSRMVIANMMPHADIVSSLLDVHTLC